MRCAALSGLVALGSLGGCAEPTHNGTSHDLAGLREGGVTDGGRDFAVPRDLAGADLAGADFAQPPDQAMAAQDLAMADLVQPRDLAVPQDLAKPPDMVQLADLARPPDMVKLADLAKPPDMTQLCVPQTQPCDVICQNCGVNLKCGVSNVGAPVCVATGNVPTAGRCGLQGVDDCVAGDVCILESQSQNLALCAAFCRTDADCKNGGKCDYTVNGGQLKICSDPVSNCDPVNETGCGAGACYVVTPVGETGCHASGAGGECGGCTTDYDCAAGYVCFGGSNVCGGVGCLHLCHRGNDFDCPGFEICYDVNDGMGGTWPNYGVCDF